MLNTIISLLLGLFLFNNTKSDLKFVELKNEEGKLIKKYVPSLNKIKTIASFQFENLTEDSDLDWWGVAFSDLLHHNLNQRPEFYTFSAYGLISIYNALGLQKFTIPNIGMQRSIAQKSRNDYFSRISYKKLGNQYELKGNLYSTGDSKSIIDLYALNEDPYSAIDEISSQISVNIPNPVETIENQILLPTSSLISNNQEALKSYTQSRIEYFNNPTTGLKDVITLAKKAVSQDPLCAMCYYYVADPLFGIVKKKKQKNM